MWNRFATALCFLTLLPCPFRPSRETESTAGLAQSFPFFPSVGLILGSCCALTGYVLHYRVPPLLLATLLTALLTVLTRGLHLDGLADLADGVGGGYTFARRLEIMKDSRTGAFGSLALALALLFKVAAFATLLRSHSWLLMAAVPALSRYAIVLTAYRSPYPRPEGGLGKLFLEHMTWQQLALAAAGGAALALALLHLAGLLYLLAASVCALLMRLLSRRWLGGVTGDVLGATNEITEIVLLSLAACLV